MINVLEQYDINIAICFCLKLWKGSSVCASGHVWLYESFLFPLPAAITLNA